MASPGYPGQYPRGAEIIGVESVDPSVHVFLAGAQRDERERLITAGGRVLCLVAAGNTIEDARDLVYDSVERISFPGAHYRTDIALDASSIPARMDEANR